MLRSLRASAGAPILQATYDFDAEHEQWLAGVANAARPRLEGDVGFFLGDYELLPPGGGGLRLRAFPAGDPRREFFREAAEQSPRDEVRVVFERAPTLSAFSEWRALTGAENFWDQFRGGAPFSEFAGLRITDGGNRALMVMGLHRRAVRVTEAQRRSWMRVAAHLSAAFRVRRALDGRLLAIEDGEAIIEPAGNVVHATGPATTASHRSRLRAAARAMDHARTRAGKSEGAMWEPLVAGRWTLVDRFDTDERRYFVAVRNDAAYDEQAGLSERERAVAALAASCHSNAEIGYALDLTESTVATHLSRALSKLRVRDRGDLSCLFEETARPLGGGDLGVFVSTERMRGTLPGLTRAEVEVARAAARGLEDREIAHLRGVSIRTVANQLAAAYRKLGVRGRIELRARLAGR